LLTFSLFKKLLNHAVQESDSETKLFLLNPFINGQMMLKLVRIAHSESSKAEMVLAADN
jgi:hypothetical protein